MCTVSSRPRKGEEEEWPALSRTLTRRRWGGVRNGDNAAASRETLAAGARDWTGERDVLFTD